MIDRDTRHRLLAQLRADEGLRLKSYRDTMGKLTIGYGRNLDDRGISEREAEMLLRADLHAAISDLRLRLPWVDELGPARHAVLIMMTFNCGVAGLLKFERMMAALDRRDYAAAATEMLASRWAIQVGDRARRLATQMRTGEW